MGAMVVVLGCGRARSQIDRDLQTRTVVVPALAFSFPEQVRANGWFISSPTRLLPCRTQCGYATGDFKLSKAALLSVGFRPPQYVNSLFSGGGT